ncbi:NADH pyrophosphatase [Trichlorobacter ammonificans]|uniref:NAD(+) diphosphatase n=2 Tax=Trichlorobacter ammonificans TaxID=2916410 RepID=A0ABN8HNJ5_9BACT|nr:NADH pyrophosphatase [Trichlorobacter ammonificans]
MERYVSLTIGRASCYEQAMAYPEHVNLPFNRQALPPGFLLLPGPGSDDGGDAHWILLQGGCVLVRETADGLQFPVGQAPLELPSGSRPLTFARWQGRPVKCLQISASAPLPAGLVAEPFNAFQERLSTALMSVAGLGKQLLHVDRLTGLCPRCGSPTSGITESWGKRCPVCRHESYPPIHPCAIVLIRRDNQLLLIRKPEWAEGRYSLVAGFLDVGESLEECAIREAREETGVTIRNLRYVASQAWPFPSQLMVGFAADYADGDIAVDDSEIADARWFDVHDLPHLPSRRSIARFLIDSSVA